MSELSLCNKTALVTGGTRGIGKAIAKRFLEAGASVAIFGTNPEKGNQTLEEFKSLLKEGQKLSFYKVDVASQKEVEESIQKVYQDLGQLDILVNNAGITKDNLLMRLSEEDWESVMNTNLKSVYNTCRAVIRPMMKTRQGKIINITSVVGL